MIHDICIYLMIGKILGFWLVNWPMIWSCVVNFLQFTSLNPISTWQYSYINLLLFRVGRVEHGIRWLCPWCNSKFSLPRKCMMQSPILPNIARWLPHHKYWNIWSIQGEFVHFYYLCRGRGGNHDSSGDTALWLRDISCIILQNSWPCQSLQIWSFEVLHNSYSSYTVWNGLCTS